MVALVAVAAIIAVVLIVAVPSLTRVMGGGEAAVEAGVEVKVDIPEGSTGDQIASILSEAGVIPERKTYFATVKEMRADTKIKPGSYSFTTLQDPQDVIEQLIAGPNLEGNTVTIPEGLTVSQTAATVADSLGISQDDFISQAKASNYVDDYPFLSNCQSDSLEGFLFPKTYSFSDTPSADEVIRAMLDQYEAEVSELDFEGSISSLRDSYGVDFTDYDVIILASIIEREALTDDQRVNVSSVFYNRLRDGMRLNSDATMMYVTGGEVTAADLQTQSPYNTYLNDGLPPTPICTPSLASIQAALNPASTDYYYFFITKDAAYFSKTYEEHQAVIEENR